MADQVTTPACTEPIIDKYADPGAQAPQPLEFQVVGSCTSAGGVLTAVSSNFTPGAQFSVSAQYPDGSPYPLALTTGTVHADGSVTWRWPCAGDRPGTYHTELTDLSDQDHTGDIPFTIGAAPRPPLPSSPPVTTTPAPTPAPGPGTTPPPAAETLDADATPAFGTCPSSPPPPAKNCGGASNSCTAHAFSAANCLVVVAQGTTIHPVCWTAGQLINNAESAVAPSAQPTLTSDVWIKVSDYPSGPWMNELWFDPDNTASHGLPHC